MKKTENELIHIGNPIPFDTEEFLVQLKKLMDAAYDNDEAICRMVAQMVPTYRPDLGGNSEKNGVYRALTGTR